MPTIAQPANKTQTIPIANKLRLAVPVFLLLVFGALILFLLAPVRKSVDTIDHPIASSADLPNFHQVHSYLFRGGAPTAQGIVELKKMGVKTIIDLRVKPSWLASESSEAHSLGINYISLPTGNFVPTKEHKGVFLKTLAQVANDPSKGPVFVHCAHGSDRTGYLVALWRVVHDRWSYVDAFKEMLRYGFIIHKFSAEKTGLFS